MVLLTAVLLTILLLTVVVLTIVLTECSVADCSVADCSAVVTIVLLTGVHAGECTTCCWNSVKRADCSTDQ